ncbi:similar to Saccharomyces cerevisiae YMR088C VBA1 Permease of basic amino acids in the vacuolar membrane [Maudiozyma saulgeensis]|uniref:Similar to Saccharomyces cerevisiae YMR088C VBA1 Permease of basic amino acids in the vacuolar membrane n=1 Tax=Maudiozyma saulgeensis TaxID=1789683 RepID=A0A1X7R3V7_9SACH|nr:similar to Saccharomyces cerevisiae YMR088C VBA1 Permease of basic amino acids in the vacuolar membrane [Kazachstania saulgeensis]
MEPLDETSSLLVQEDNRLERTVSALERSYSDHNLSLPKIPIIFSLWMGSFLSSIDSTIVANIMNGVAEEFQESNKKQWIATSYLLTNTAFQPLYGKLSDIVGRKFAVLTAHFFFGLGCLLTCFAQNVTQFAIARAVCGIGGGGINAMSSITTSDICTTRERGIYQGYANIVFGTGQILGGPIGGIFLDSIGWRPLFAVQVPLIMLCSYLTSVNVNIKLVHVPPFKERFTWKNLSRIDILGSSSLVITISSILFLTSTDMNKTMLTIITIVSFGFFLWVETSFAKERIIPFELLKGPFGLSSIATVFSSFIVFGDIFRSPIYIQLIQNISVTKSGLYLLFPSMATAVGSIMAGHILRKTKLNIAHCASIITFNGMILQFTGLIIEYTVIGHLQPSLATKEIIGSMLNPSSFELQSESYTWKILFVSAGVLVTFGYSLLLVATLVSIVFTVEKSQQGTMTGIFYLWRSIGNVLGASLTLVVYENTLSKLLWNYMFGNREGSSTYEFTKAQYYKMISDSAMLRNSGFPKDTLRELLNVYRSSFLVSYYPNITLALFGIIILWFLLRIYNRVSKNTGVV